VYGDIVRMFPKPGSGNGYEAHSHIYPVLMMLIDGGEHIEDVRKIGCDKGLRKIGLLETVPSGDAVGKWLKRDSACKVKNLECINENLSEKLVKRARVDITLDIDAFEIKGEKESAQMNYKGNKGYMPMAGFIAGIGNCIGYEFREGNVPPAAGNYRFAKGCFDRIGRMGKRVSGLRSDSAAYNSEVINYVNGQGACYAITVDQDVAVKAGIRNIPEGGWKKLSDEKGFEGSDREYAEFVHTMNKADHPFRIVVQRWVNPHQELFEEAAPYCYHGIATNYEQEKKGAVEIIRWHNGRANSENYNKELKSGFSLRHVPCNDFGGNDVWFGLTVLAYNIFVASKIFLFPESWQKKTIRTVRYEFVHMAGKVLSRGRQIILRICSTLRETFEIYVEARQRCRELLAVT
jgi:hypothetical protein